MVNLRINDQTVPENLQTWLGELNFRMNLRVTLNKLQSS